MIQKLFMDSLQYLRDTPKAVEVLAWIITLLLVGVLGRVMIGKQIRERKRFLQYNQKIEQNMHKMAFSHLSYSEPIAHTKSKKLSTVVLLIGMILVILSLCVMYIIGFITGGDWFETSPWGRLFGPLLSFILLLLLLVVFVFAIWALCKFLKRGDRKKKIPMRIRVIKCRGGRLDDQ